MVKVAPHLVMTHPEAVAGMEGTLISAAAVVVVGSLAAVVAAGAS